MTENIVRLSDDVSYSTDRAILAGWKESSDELLIWRRPDFDVAAVDAYIDFMATEHSASLRALDRMYFLYDTKNGFITPHRDVDHQKIEEFGLMPGPNLFRKIFSHEAGKTLMDDVHDRLSSELNIVFPAAKTISLHLRTMTAPGGKFERFHIDDNPVLGLGYGKFGTEYLRSNKDLSEEELATIRTKRSIRPDLVSKSQLEALKSGDVSVMKFKPHRPNAKEMSDYKFWLGAVVID